MLILSNIADVLYRVRRDTGFLRDININNDKALITCPNHHNGRENKPSCIINLWDSGTYKAGEWHCFSCKIHGTIQQLVAKCYNIDEIKATRFLLDNFGGGEIEDRGNLLNTPTRASYTQDCQEDLKQYMYYHPYLYKRGLTDETIEKFNLGWDEKTNEITFPIYENNKLLFVARRSIDKKRFNLPTNIDKPLCYLKEALEIDTTEIFVVESLFNALTLFQWGKPAIALLGTGTASQHKKLKQLPHRRLILALDNDPAGDVGTKKIKYKVQDKLINVLKINKLGKDINDFHYCNTYEEFLKEGDVTIGA